VAAVNHSFFTCLISHPFGDGSSLWLEPQNIAMVVQLIKVMSSVGILGSENPTASASYH